MPTGINYLSAIPDRKGETWNPVTGCTPCSPGCANCWAQSMLRRYKKQSLTPVCHPDRLNKPLRWKKPRMVGVCYMGDLFHADVPAGFIGQVLQVTYEAPQHTYLLLTKRAERMRDYFIGWLESRSMVGCPYSVPGDNVWLGVSVCNQAEADEKIPLLQATPAAKRVISAEPQLEYIDWGDFLRPSYTLCESMECGGCCEENSEPCDDYKQREASRIHWLIQGCLSGAHPQPWDEDWARETREWCREAGAAYYLKQSPDPKRKGRVIHTPGLDGDPCQEVPE